MANHDTTVLPLETTASPLSSNADASPGRQGGLPLAKPDWVLGLKLHPEHFRRQDRYHEELVRFALRAAFDPPWGVAELALNDDALDAGLIQVTRFRAILPDGTFVTAGDAQIPARNLSREARGRSRTDIYIGVPLGSGGTSAAHEEPRYVREVALVPDYGTGRGAIEVPWCRPNVQILTTDDSLAGYATLPIGRVHYVQGQATLDPSFVPPVVRLRASPALEACVRRIERRLVATQDAMMERRPAAEMTGGDAGRLLVASMIGRFVPTLRGLLATDPVHPREAYGVLASLAGALSAFAPSGTIDVPSFEILALGEVFARLEAAVVVVLNAIGGPSIRSVPLHQHDENHWRTVGPFEPGAFGREFVLVLSGGDAASLHAGVPRAAKVAAWEEIGDIVQRALPGVALLPELRRPHGIPVPAHAACFRLERRGPQWSAIMNYGSIAVWLPQALASLTPTLYMQEPNAFGG